MYEYNHQLVIKDLSDDTLCLAKSSLHYLQDHDIGLCLLLRVLSLVHVGTVTIENLFPILDRGLNPRLHHVDAFRYFSHHKSTLHRILAGKVSLKHRRCARTVWFISICTTQKIILNNVTGVLRSNTYSASSVNVADFVDRCDILSDIVQVEIQVSNLLNL